MFIELKNGEQEYIMAYLEFNYSHGMRKMDVQLKSVEWGSDKEFRHRKVLGFWQLFLNCN